MKNVHFSIDDVWKSLRYITYNKPNSIFDLRLYSKLKEWHENYDVKVTLYLIACAEGFLISEIPEDYMVEFEANKDWLYFGYHSKNEKSFRDELGYKAGFELVDNTIKKMHMGETDILRLHSWYCSSIQKEYLYKKGVRTLLYPDDDCLKYGMDDMFIDCDLIHRRTRCWVEKMNSIDDKTCCIGKEFVAIFTHEWCFDQQVKRIEKMIDIYKNAGYKFIS